MDNEIGILKTSVVEWLGLKLRPYQEEAVRQIVKETPGYYVQVGWGLIWIPKKHNP